MGFFDKAKAILGIGGAAAGAASTGPVSAIAGAIGGVGNAVAAVNQKADHAQMLEAGAAKGKLEDVAETEKRVGDAAAARTDKRVRDDIDKTRYRD